MKEKKLIDKTAKPNTRESIVKDLKALGLKKGIIVLVHSSLSSLGWTCGGEISVIQALMDVITEEGTIIMPTQSSDYSNPELWGNPAVPKSWINTIKEKMPAYDPNITPTRGMGRIVEAFRKFPNVLRSSHPTCSFGAWGKYSKEIIENHSLEYSLGENSPLARIYDLNGYVLLLGVGYDSNTSYHLSEYRSKSMKTSTFESPIIEEGKRVWKKYKDIEFNADMFPKIGLEFEKNHKIDTGLMGNAKCKFFKQRAAVDFAEKWLLENSKNS
ncbi:aminoglycoside N(3)-acetyltransferase [Dethiothermospora halolimnae]|uniref:aminoglycoside N(3)-acetyltransferase n=1 Tax=Dethiothermospora halolimnae TaxID=3114390 RepID=UPI003CCBBD3F